MSILEVIGLFFLMLMATKIYQERAQSGTPRTKKEIKPTVVDEPVDVQLSLEVHEGWLYLRDANTDKFFCQGSTYDELVSTFLERFPKKRALIVACNPAAQEHLHEIGVI